MLALIFQRIFLKDRNDEPCSDSLGETFREPINNILREPTDFLKNTSKRGSDDFPRHFLEIK